MPQKKERVKFYRESNLKRICGAYGYTQAEFAKRSGVSLCSIQMYEQRNKDIRVCSHYRLKADFDAAWNDILEGSEGLLAEFATGDIE